MGLALRMHLRLPAHCAGQLQYRWLGTAMLASELQLQMHQQRRAASTKCAYHTMHIPCHCMRLQPTHTALLACHPSYTASVTNPVLGVCIGVKQVLLPLCHILLSLPQLVLC